MLGSIDRAIRWAFPKRMFPSSMLSGDYWAGLTSGIFVGSLLMVATLSESAQHPLYYYPATIAALAVLRFITWRVSKVDE